MSRCLTVHRHMEVAAIHAKKARTALAADDADAILPPSPATAPVAAGDATDPAAITLKLFQTDSSNTLPCVHALIKAHYHSMRSLRHVLVPPPPALPLQFEGLTSQQVEQLTGPIRDVCESLTTRDFSMVLPTSSNVHLMGSDVFYVSLYHGETMMMGIFFMPPHAVIPLHDHPCMSVVSRVLYGAVHLKAYSIVDANSTDDDGHHALLARRSRDKLLQAPCTMELSPSHHNIHELVAAGDIGCAIFDVMIPPYDEYDQCIIFLGIILYVCWLTHMYVATTATATITVWWGCTIVAVVVIVVAVVVVPTTLTPPCM
ncbi:hypothetical protein, variant 2 [Aphanomyces astaci]|uniref:Cysteine dioxygenase n=1 Tax=Aphanomyces astaci TaxID=112090 RepID=W4H2Y3_APHAT|nr:hypothetical protein, variant 2 [Aphanomyces astaci]ETV85518.1 hypothetical protein, variant 2 [Aphanomyces astaci]|eukprot:XP_009825536.1 hypothetical protein, variant 2 [Aphanomyces astaci]